MNTITPTKSDGLLRGKAKLLQHLYGFMDGVAIRCALKLGIADIINSHNMPTSLTQIARDINSQSLNIDGLARLMRFLVHKQIFDQVDQLEGEETLYALNDISKWLLSDSRHLRTSLVPLATMVTESELFLSPLYGLDRTITEGGTVFMATYGEEFFNFAALNSDFSRIFNDGMACQTRITMDAVMSNYDFNGLSGTLVDVGGGTGVAIHEIVTAYPHLCGVNFDLSHVLATAPTYDRVTHVPGDMFESIPKADSIFLKFILHNWSDSKCVEILKNCQRAIPKTTGKVIIVDVVLHPGRHDLFDDTRLVYDLLMFAYFNGGKERTEDEWKKILNEAGFRRYNFIKIPAFQSIIEAYSY